MPHKVFIVGSPLVVGNIFKDRGWELTDVMKEADLVQFTGGEDISPSLYKQKPHPVVTWVNPQRDNREVMAYTLAKKMNKPMAGICRGAQLLNVMMGGRLYQHVNNHGFDHEAEDITGRKIKVSSCHHQMIIPSTSINSILVLWATGQSTVREVMGVEGAVFKTKGPFRDIEAIAYPNYKIFGVQGHPEYDGFNEFTDKYFQWIDQYCLGYN